MHLAKLQEYRLESCMGLTIIWIYNLKFLLETLYGAFQILNELCKTYDGTKRTEGKPAQKVVGPDNGPVQVEYRTIEEVHMFLLERGIDSLRVPPPPMKLIGKE
jgi:hypothetical protein